MINTLVSIALLASPVFVEPDTDSLKDFNAFYTAKISYRSIDYLASTIIDLGRGTQSFINDGIPSDTFVDARKGIIHTTYKLDSAMPVLNRDIQQKGFMGTGLFKGSPWDTAPKGIFVERGLRAQDYFDIGSFFDDARRMQSHEYRTVDPRNNMQLTRARASETLLEDGYQRVD